MLIVNNKALKITNKWLNPVAGSGPTPPGPTPPGPTPTLPAYTLRLKYNTGVVPTLVNNKGTLTQVSSSPNIWDWTYENADWHGEVIAGSIVPNMSINVGWNSETSTYYNNEHDTVIEVISGNTTGVTNMGYLFAYNTNITTLPLLDTSTVTNMESFVMHCARLEYLPLFDTHNVTSFFQFTASLRYYRDIDTIDPSTVNIKYCSNKLKSIPNFDISSIGYNTTSGNIAPYFSGMWINTPWMEDAQSLQTMFDKLYARFPTYDSDALDSVAPFWWCGYYTTYNQGTTTPVYPNAQVQAVVESIPATWKKYHD